MSARTFDPDKLVWFDFETRSGEDLSRAGATRYACDPDAAAIILTYAIGRGPVYLVTAPVPGEALTWDTLPIEFRACFADRTFAAYNAGFDRAIWNYTLPGSPHLLPRQVIDPLVQATAAGLPPDLAGACKASGSTAKVENGDEYIKLFCVPGADATPQSHPAEWAKFCAYAIGDIEAMRSLFLRTRQLPLREWEEYWAMEAINDRGVQIDAEFCRRADALAQVAKVRNGLELRKLTMGHVTSVGQVGQLVTWLCNRLPLEGIAILTKEEKEEAEDGTITQPARYSLTRSRIETLIPYCQSIGDEKAERALQIRLYGGSTTPAKYARILGQEVDGAIYGQYVFNGAPQTGRASSRGVQIQNLSRSFLPYEDDAIESILAGDDYDAFAKVGDDTPVARKLALLIRPAFVSRETNQFVVSDFSQIEARVLPWLVGPKSKGARDRLAIFEAVDANPSVPDIYTRTAAAISGLPIAEINKPLRQRGKVAELALGFGGGTGALASMGANYGLYLPHAEAVDVVKRWRAANAWCVRFWGKHTDDESYGLWGAANRALEQPGTEQHAGRITYVYLRQVLGGTLYCRLPSGRCLTYRGIKYERVIERDDNDKVISTSTQLRFWKGHMRSIIWRGTLCENVVQATAADILRGTLVRLEMEGPGARLHSHDEVLLEVPTEDAAYAARTLREIMCRGFAWTEWLPIRSEETVQPYYSKWEA